MTPKCKKCGATFIKRMLHRTNPKGQKDAGWMCAECINKFEPELHKNMQEDGDFKEEKDIMNAIKSVFK